MADIANGSFLIRLAPGTPAEVTRELAQAIARDAPIHLDGPMVSKDGLEIDAYFSARWTTEDTWDWLDEQMDPAASLLSPAAREALVASEIEGNGDEEIEREYPVIKKECQSSRLSRTYTMTRNPFDEDEDVGEDESDD